MDPASLFVLSLSCTALSPSAHVAAVAVIASEGDVYRVEVDGRPVAASDAFALASEAVARGRHVMVGLDLLTPEELQSAGLALTDGLSACRALSGLDFMADNLDAAVDDDRWTRAAAIRASGSGDPVAIADFAAQIESIVSALPDEGGLARARGIAVPLSKGTAHAPVRDDVPVSVEPMTAERERTPDVFQSQGASRLLIFSDDK